MYLISNRARQEAIEFLKEFSATKCDAGDLKGVNARRRAKVLVSALVKAQKHERGMDKD